MKCLADQKLKTKEKTAPSTPPPSISLASFVSTLWLSSLWLPRLALRCFARHATKLGMLTFQLTSIAFSWKKVMLVGWDVNMYNALALHAAHLFEDYGLLLDDTLHFLHCRRLQWTQSCKCSHPNTNPNLNPNPNPNPPAFPTYNQPDIQDGPFPTPCFILKHNQQDHKNVTRTCKEEGKDCLGDIGRI